MNNARMAKSTFALVSALVLCSPAVLAAPDDGSVGAVSKIVDNGGDAERFDVVLLAEGYTSAELETFGMQAQVFADALFATAPFSTNCSAINVWRIDVASNESGADDPSSCSGGTGATVATYFDATACADGSQRRLVRVNEATALDVLNENVPGWDQAIVLVNTDTYGGSSGSVTVSTTTGPWDQVAIHEMAHSAFGLADEYDYFDGCDVDVDRDVHPAVEPAESNVTTDATGAKWSDLISVDTPLPTTENEDCEQCDPQGNPFPDETVVGTFEGAHYYHCDAYRSAFDCTMRNFASFCPVCTRRILETLAPFQPDNTPPVCDANGPYEFECLGETSAVMLDGSASSDLDCDELSFSWTGDFEEETADGVEPIVNFAGLGDFGVDLEVSDEDSSDTCSSQVTIEDTTSPAIEAPDDVDEECTSPDGTSPELGDPVVADVCDPAATVSNDAPDLFPLGDTEVVWTATDASGNSATDAQHVTIVDTTPPDFTDPDPVTEECASPDGTPVALDDPVVQDICDAEVDVVSDAPDLFPLGETEVIWTATDDSLNSSTATQLVSVVDTTPPEITAPEPVTAECTSPDGTPVELGEATASDVCDAEVEVANDAPDLFPLGETEVTWTATDDSDNVGTDAQAVTIVDTTPPTFTLSVEPAVLWPPNHKLVSITALVDVSDICDPELDVKLVSITSNESDNDLGDGNTTDDIQDADFDTDDRTFQLRAERSGRGQGRVYTIVYSVEDDSGNVTLEEATVTVPKSQGRNQGRPRSEE
jgi:hypothetical protein